MKKVIVVMLIILAMIGSYVSGFHFGKDHCEYCGDKYCFMDCEQYASYID